MTIECVFCKGTGIEPGQIECVWCNNTGRWPNSLARACSDIIVKHESQSAASELDAALTREAALREELRHGNAALEEAFKDLQSYRQNYVTRLAYDSVRNDLQQRLTAAEQRNAELERELEVYRGAPAGYACVGLRKDGDLFIHVFPADRTAQACMQHHKELGYVCAVKPVTLTGNDAALNPTESGASNVQS